MQAKHKHGQQVGELIHSLNTTSRSLLYDTLTQRCLYLSWHILFLLMFGNAV